MKVRLKELVRKSSSFPVRLVSELVTWARAIAWAAYLVYITLIILRSRLLIEGITFSIATRYGSL